MAKNTVTKREKEKATVSRMIALYCRKRNDWRKRMNIKKIGYIILGFIGLGLGAIGAVIPMLPAFPFLLLAAFGFGKSSERLHTWFIGTKLYKNNLETYVKGQGMTWPAKFRIMGTVTAVMAVSAAIMLYKGVIMPCYILLAVWIFHILYFVFRVKTLKVA